MDSRLKVFLRKSALILSAAVIACLTAGFTLADETQKAVSSAEGLVQKAARHQSKVNELDRIDQESLAEYRSTLLEIDMLKKNIDQYENAVKGQKSEIERLQEESTRVEELKGNLYPFLKSQVANLSKFISLDIPFLLEERKKRIDNLQSILRRSDISDAEKYRIISEAYEIEVEYGRTLQVYRGTAPSATHTEQAVDYLRVGRVGWFYRTLDRTALFGYEAAAQKWVPLPDSLNQKLDIAFAVARKEKLPEYLTLPLSEES